MINQNNTSESVKTIQKKLLGKRLTYHEISALMDEIGHQRLGDVLTTYFVAASFKEGFSHEELYLFTKAMVETGNRLRFKGIVADKHSTGGVSGTRTTLIVVPIIAAAGFKIPKISSRAITTPAGTADVMETIANVNFKIEDIEDIVNKTGGCISWNGKLGIAPADDVIIRVEEPLSFESFDKIIVSIMAKKIAASTTHLILDIPVGKTMKIRHEADAHKILKKFQQLGGKFGMKVEGIITKTHEPAGNGVGPALEIVDVLKVLEQTKDRSIALEKRALDLAGGLLSLCYKDARSDKDGKKEALALLQSGAALSKFKEIVKAQGGSGTLSSKTFKINAKKHLINSTRSGTIKEINNFNLNSIAKMLGAPKDKFAGVYLYKKIGDKVQLNEPLLAFYSNSPYLIEEAEHSLKSFPIHKFSEPL